MKPWLLFIVVCTCLLSLTIRAAAQANHQDVSDGALTTAINFPGTCTYNWTADNASIGIDVNGTSRGIAQFRATNNGNTPITVTITATPQQPSYAYIPNYVSGDVSVINLANNTRGINIPTGQYPYGVATSPDGTKAYVTNTGPNTVTIINTANNATHQVSLGPGSGRGLVVSPDGSRVYVANTDLDVVNVINTVTETALPPINVGQKPIGMAISPDGSKIYVTNYDSHSVSVINTANNTVQNIDVKAGPHGVTVSADGKLVYVTNELDDKVTIIDAATNTVKAFFSVGATPYGIAVSPDGSRLYVSCAVDNKLWVIDANTHNTITLIQVGNYPYGVAINSIGSAVYVSNINSNDVSVINTSTNNIDAVVNVGTNPYALGNSISQGISCSPTPVQYIITVNPANATINLSAASGTISACAGSASTNPNIQQFTLDASALTTPLTATAPPGFEISLNAATGYNSTVTINPVAGAVSNKVVYVRTSATAPVGNVSGSVQISAGQLSKTVAVTGVVNALPSVNKIPDQVKTSGQTIDAINFTGNANTFRWTNDNPAVGLPANGEGNIASFIASNTGKQPITAKITVTPGISGFVFMTNFYDGTVSMINTATNKVAYTFPVGFQPHGVNINPDGSRVYVTNVASRSVSVIDVASHSVIATITVGKNPLGVALNSAGDRVYVTNSGDNTLSVIDAAANTVINTVKVGEYPIGVSLSADNSKIYVANDLGNTITVLNAANNSFIKNIAVATNPNNMLLSPDGKRLYVANTSSITIIDPSTDAVVGTMVSGSIMLGLAISPDGTRLYTNNNPPSNSVVYVFDTATNSIVNTIPIGNATEGLSISPDGSSVYVSNTQSNSVKVIDTKTETVIADVPTGRGAGAVGRFVTAGSPCTGTPITFTITIQPLPVPTLQAAGVLAALTSVYSKPSAATTNFTISGNNLTSAATIKAPLGFEISTDNTTFSRSLTIGAAGTLNSTTIYVRLAPGTNVGNYTGDIVATANGATDIVLPVTGTVNPAKLTITANSVHKIYGTLLLNQSNSVAFSVSGLQNAESVGSVDINYGTGAAATDPVNTYPGSVTPLLATGGTFKAGNYIITYLAGDIVVDAVPIIIATGNLPSLTTVYGTPSASAGFQVSGTALTAGILVTPPTGFEVSLDNATFSNTITTPLSGNTSSATVFIRLSAITDAGTYAGNITVSSAGALSQTLYIVNNVVNKAPLVITANNVTKTYGDQLSDQTGFINFTSQGLQNSETVNSSSITYAQGAAATDNFGTYTGSVRPYMAVGTFKTDNYNISYNNGNIVVNKALLTITAVNKNKKYGDPNPQLTINYGGFKNGESSAVLTTMPSIETTAQLTSPVGQYPITVSGAGALNYDLKYVDGVLSIEAVKIDIYIPNAFSPNGDGRNDLWDIRNLDNYPGSLVEVFNRYGQKIFSSVGYTTRWDGRYVGNNLPSATYYYIVNPQNGDKVLSGNVTILR